MNGNSLRPLLKVNVCTIKTISLSFSDLIGESSVFLDLPVKQEDDRWEHVA